MSPQSWDPSGKARDALKSVVDSHGPRVLSNPQELSNLLEHLLPDSPREATLLVTAAQSDIAGMLQLRVGQPMDPDRAVRLSATALGERRDLDRTACVWVTTEFARVLGYPVTDAPAVPGTSAEHEPADGTRRPQPTSSPPSADEVDSEAGTELGIWHTGPVPANRQPPSANEVDAEAATELGIWREGPAPANSQPPGGSQTAAGGGPTSASKRRNRAIVAGPIVLALLAVIYFGVAAGAHLPPFSKGTVGTALPPANAPTNPFATPSATTSATPAAGQAASLAQLLPGDIDASRNCAGLAPPVPGFQKAAAVFSCTDASLPNGHIYAYMFDNPVGYQVSLAAFNLFLGFNPAATGGSCPPRGTSQGQRPWSQDPNYPQVNGQILECLTAFDPSLSRSPTYLWTFPNTYAFLYAQADRNGSFTDLEKWWTAHRARA
jgi:hypothetical protein